MKGSVNSTISGLRITLKKLSNTTTTSNVVPLSHEMPIPSLVARVTPSARIAQRRTSCRNAEFIAMHSPTC